MAAHRLRRRLAVLLTPLALVASIGLDAPVHAEAYPTIDGQYSGTGKLTPGGSFSLKVTGRGGVPETGVGAVALNVAVTNPSASSYLTAFPTGAAQPTAANLVFDRAQTVPNMVIVKVGAGGQITFFNYAGTTDVVVDVLGWFPEGQSFTGLTPARLMDTRPGYPTIDAQFAGDGPAGPGGTKLLTVTGRGGVPSNGVGAVALNVTVAAATAPSFLTVWPTGAPRPTAANLNYRAGQTVPNMVMARVGEAGQVSMFNYAGSADLVVDVLGWFPDTGSFTGTTPARLMDTRTGYPTIDGQAAGMGSVGANGTIDLSVLARGNVPATGVGAVALNVAVTNPTATSFVTVYPTGAPRPTAANLNFVPGQTVPNMVIVKVGDAGRVSFFNYAGSADLVVDVLGWFPEGQAYIGLTPARLMDSRRDPAPPPGAPAGSHICSFGETDYTSQTWIDTDGSGIDEFVQYCADDPVATGPGTTTTTTTTAPPSTTTTNPPVTGNVTPGAFCTPVGATGTYNGLTYVCATTNADGVPYNGGRAHWRRA